MDIKPWYSVLLKKKKLFVKKFDKNPVMVFEICVLWLVGMQNYLVRQQFFN